MKNNTLTPEDWKQRWQDGHTGWHKNVVHPALIKYFERLELTAGDQVFVPLCGSSVDMEWLAEQGINIIGCEISDKAIAGFFERVELQPEKTRQDELVSWKAGSYTLYQGDYFAMQANHVERIRAVYDCASLIALPREGETGRKAYLRKMRELVSDEVKTLLITLDYEQPEFGGPPYPVGYEEIVWQYAFDHIIEFISEQQTLVTEPCLRQHGLNRVTEWVYLMTHYTPVYANVTAAPRDF